MTTNQKKKELSKKIAHKINECKEEIRNAFLDSDLLIGDIEDYVEYDTGDTCYSLSSDSEFKTEVLDYFMSEIFADDMKQVNLDGYVCGEDEVEKEAAKIKKTIENRIKKEKEKEVKRSADPEYLKYLELKKKFENN